jgi:SET domain-containing protein
LGLFAVDAIASGTVLFQISGKVVRTDELTDDFIRKGIMQGIAPGYALIRDKGSRSLFSYMNHSCDCNCGVDLQNLQVYTLRAIGADEELTLNYCLEPRDERVRRLMREVIGRPCDTCE